jgi:hypothetical protein
MTATRNRWARGPVVVLCVDKATDALSTGATISATGSQSITLTGSAYIYGMTFRVGGILTLCNATTVSLTFEQCTLGITSGSSSNRQLILGRNATYLAHRARFLNCAIDFDTSGGGSTRVDIRGGVFEFVGGTFRTSSNAAAILRADGGSQGIYTFRGVDFSSSTETTLVTHNGTSHQITFDGCRLPASYTVLSGTIDASGIIRIESSVAGSITDPPLGLTSQTTQQGTVASVLTRYRTGGADDGEQANAHSWEMATGTAAVDRYLPLESPPLVRWVDGGSAITATVYVASGVTLQDDEFWIEVTSPDAAGTAYSQYDFYSSRVAPQGTPANLTTDSVSTWNGTGVGTKQKITTPSFTPTNAGPAIVRCYLAKPSTTVYVDPLIEIA